MSHLKTKAIIISPSGNLYGSEQVLLDYLGHTKIQYTVFVPRYSLLETKIHKSGTSHIIKNFNNEILQWLYFKIIVQLIFGFADKVYWNEGGHIRYAKLLANIFKKNTFYVHIRIIEDTTVKRLGKIPDNLKLITISDFMYDLISPNYNVTKIYDPFTFTEKVSNRKQTEGKIRIGIVGRITKTKGLDYLNKLLLKLEDENNTKYEFHFFGDPVNEDDEVTKLKAIASRKIISVIFHGFVIDIDSIYFNIDILLHLSKKEPLGRIIFECISYDLPYIVFNNGGTAEISKKLGLEGLLINMDYKNEWLTNLYELMDKISGAYQNYVNLISSSKPKLSQYFSIEEYVQKMDSKLQ